MTRGKPRLIGSEIFRRSSFFGMRHPLAIPRVTTCVDLCRALGWLPDSQYIDSPRATPEQLMRFHEPAYVAAIMEAQESHSLSAAAKMRFNIGVNGNPIYPEIFERPATAVGGSLLAADMIADGGVVFNPAGGTHHGRPGRANGFCYFNDIVLAILALLDGGIERVFYLDIDAHHGDGVQDAFSGDARVLTVSVHEDGRWPMSRKATAGSVDDRAGCAARNVAVPQGLNDSEMAFILDAAVLPLAAEFAPGAVVLQCGTDALEDDPQSRLSLSNRALWRVVSAVGNLAPRLLVVGGGGYNPWSVGRCWAGVWAVLNGFDIPSVLPAAAESVLRGLSWRHRLGRNPPENWFTTLADAPNPGPVRREVRDVVAAVVAP
jgi:acetoin utilization protein AcuC